MKSVEELILDRLTSIEALLRAQVDASLNVLQASEYLGVSERTLIRYVELGRLTALDMSTEPGGVKRGRLMFRRTDLDEFRTANRLEAEN